MTPVIGVSANRSMISIAGPAMGKYLMPGTPLAGEHSAEEIRKIAAGLN